MFFPKSTIVILAAICVRLFGASESGRCAEPLRHDLNGTVKCSQPVTNGQTWLPDTIAVTESKTEFWNFAQANTTEIVSTALSRRSKRVKDGLSKHSHKKKKHKKWLYIMFKKLKKAWPQLMKKMHGPSMFMLGMAQANFNNFIMHALMMSKMALVSVIMMIIREMVFGDKDEPVKYYNFGYDEYAPHRRIITSYTYDYKRRRKRRMLWWTK